MQIVRAIVNPVSGRGQRGRLLEQLAAALPTHGYQFDLQFTQRAGDATRLAAETPDGARAVIVIGGDGTVREAVEGLTGRRVPMLAVPGGTENIVAKHFRMPRTLEGVLVTLEQGRPAACDVGVVNGHKFLVVVGVGFDAEVVHRLAATRRGHISYLDYVAPLWSTFWRHSFPQVEVQVDGPVVFSGTAMTFIGNLPRYSLGLRLLDRAREADGLLDVCVYPCRSRTGLVGHSLRTLLRRHLADGGVCYRQGRTVRVRALESRPIPVEMDGDPAGTLPLECTLIPGGVQLLLPPGAPSRRLGGPAPGS